MAESEFQKRRQEEERELQEFVRRLDALRKTYDRFFMGQEKILPQPARDKLNRDFRASKLNKARNTSVKFRFQNLMMRLSTYTSYWERQMRRIEDGSFRPGDPKTR